MALDNETPTPIEDNVLEVPTTEPGRPVLMEEQPMSAGQAWLLQRPIYNFLRRVKFLLIGSIVAALLIVGGTIAYSRSHQADSATVSYSALLKVVPEQNIQPTRNIPALHTYDSLLSGGGLEIHGKVLVVGADGTSVELQSGMGSVCFESNNCSYGTAKQTVSLQTQVYALSSNTVSSINGQKGGISLQGTPNQVNILANGGVISLTTPQSIGTTANVNFASVTGGKLSAKATSSSSTPLIVQDNSGKTLLSASAATNSVTTTNILPVASSSGVAGSYTPSYYQNNAVYTAINSNGSGPYNDISRWGVKGNDGYMRYVYMDWNTYDIMYLRCTSDDCSSPVTNIVATDPSNGTDTPSIALDGSGNAYISYVDYTSPNNTIRLVHCLDPDCAGVTDNLIGTTPQQYGWIAAVNSGPDGMARVVYDSYGSGDASLWFVRCLDSACSSYNDKQLDSSTASNYFETDDVVIGADGKAYVLYVDEVSNNIVLDHCSDLDCSSFSTTTFPGGDYYLSMAMGSDGLIRFIYETDGGAGNYTLELVRCTNVSCSTSTSETLYVSDGKYVRYASLVLMPGDLPAMIFAQLDSGNNTHVYGLQCQDEDCSTSARTEVTLVSDSWGVHAFLGTDAKLSMANLANGSDDISIINDVMDTLVPAVDVAPQQSLGSAIGSSTNRFGQIYGSSLNLQSYGSTVLTVNNSNGDGLSGEVASFQVNGVEAVGISGSGNLNVGSASAVVQNPALLNLIGSASNTSDLLHAYDANGNIAFSITADGSISAGGLYDCTDGCIPTTLLGQVNARVGDALPDRIIDSQGYLYTSSGSYAIDSTNKVSIYNLSDTTNPRLVARAFRTTDSYNAPFSEGFKVGNGYGYYITSSKKIMTVDLTDPEHPEQLGTITAGDVLYGLGIDGNYLYASGDNGVYVYDISSGLPTLTGSVAHSGYLRTLTISGNTVYAADQISGVLYAIDVTNPASPNIVGSLDIKANFSSHLTVSNGVLYATCFQNTNCPTYGSVVRVDVSDPTAMSMLSPLDLGQGKIRAPWLQISGNYLYASNGAELYSYDISSPAAPVLSASESLGVELSRFVVGDNLLYGIENNDSGNIDIFGNGPSASLQKLQVETATVNSQLQVGGAATFSGNTTISNGSNLIVTGLRAPVYTVSMQSTSGSIPATPGITYYYKFTALTPSGESAAASYSVDRNSFNTVPHNGAGIVASAGGSGALNGTYRYKITYVTSYGESNDATNNSPASVTVANQKVTLSNIYVRNDVSLLAINVYRCSMPTCSSYNLVGSIPNPTPFYTTFTDNNTSPTTAIPTVDNAYTDSNLISFSFKDLPVGTTAVRAYKSTDGVNYTYVDTPVNSLATVFYIDFGTGAGTTGTAPTEASGGHLAVGTTDPTATLEAIGTTLLQSDTNSTNAVRIQNSSGNVLFDADTLNQRIGIGTATPAAVLQVNAAGGGTPLFRVTDTTPTAINVLDIADGGATIFRNQTDSTTAFRIQNAAGTTLFTADSTNLAITITGLLNVNGHIKTGNTSGTTTAAPGAGAGASATCTISGNDTGGLVTITTGASGTGAGTLCTLTFAGAFSAGPRVFLTPAGNAGATIQYNVGSVTTTNFTVSSGSLPATSTAYKYYYLVVQ